MFTKKDAKAIAVKFGVKPEPAKKHDIVYIRFEGRIVAKYGIRRGSHNEAHPYIPAQLYLTNRQTKELASCSLSTNRYFEILREAGRL